MNKDEFVKRSLERHGNIYSYEHVPDKVTIICSKHGDFKQLAGNHLNGLGCYQCGIDKIKEFNKDSVANIKETLNKVHNGKYSYAFFDAYDSKGYSLIEIVCPEHTIIEELQPEIDEFDYFKAWNAGHNKLKYWYQNRF